MTKIAAVIDQRRAIMRGSNASGRVEVEVDVSSLPEPVRRIIAGWRTESGITTTYDVDVPTPEDIIALATRQAEERAAHVEAAVQWTLATPMPERLKGWDLRLNAPTKTGLVDGDYHVYWTDPRVSTILSEMRAYADEVEAAEAAKRQAEASAMIAQMNEGREEKLSHAEQWQKEKEERSARRRQQIDAWVADHGTPNQQARHRRGMLSEDEMIDAMSDEVFAPLLDLPRHRPVTKDEVTTALDIDDDHVTIYVDDLDAWTAEQYDLIERIEAAIPGAVVEIREHVGYDSRRPRSIDPDVRRCSALVTVQVGEIALEREFEAPPNE